MKTKLTRRSFLGTCAAGSAGAVLGLPLIGPRKAEAAARNGVCLTVCNHWSYIGIGWQLGIESCVLSVTDAMEMADRPPHVKTCVNLDARAYEFMAEKFPEVTDRLKPYLAAGKVELIGGTYGQPMGTTISGESNIRQIVMGREVIRRALGYDMATFLEEEEFTHPQIPQIARLAGFRYASLAQLDTWGRAGCPRQDLNVLGWKGIDGTVIPCVPKNALFGYAPDLKKLAASPEFQKLAGLGKPLIFAWEEFGWESPEEPAYLSAPARYRTLEDVEFVTLKGYLDEYGSQGKETVFLPMDAWNKSLTWGLGGDQVRILDRKVDALLLAAELFDGIAAALGRPSQAAELEKAWRDLLASQSHDVGLCEYSRWQGDRMAPLDRIEDRHNFTWGAIGYN
ncbi:MAG: glycoside hydrolase family 38 N-terminal domain-containing protein, partial [Candidatus Aminicenantales bacterium]